MAGLILADGRTLRTEDYLADTRFSHNRPLDDWARAEGTRGMIGAPILDREGKVIAILWAYHRGPVAFTDKDETVIVGLAQQAALAIGTARGMEGERQRARQTSSLLEIAQVCASTLELKPLLRAVARQVAQALGAERCTINLFQGPRLVPVMAQFADGHVDNELWTKFKALGQSGIQALAGRRRGGPHAASGGDRRRLPLHPRYLAVGRGVRPPLRPGGATPFRGSRHRHPVARRDARPAALEPRGSGPRHDHGRPGRPRRGPGPAIRGVRAARHRGADAVRHRRGAGLDAGRAGGAGLHRGQRHQADGSPARGGVRDGRERRASPRPRDPRDAGGQGLRRQGGAGGGGRCGGDARARR